MFRRINNQFLRYTLIACYFLIIFLCAVEINFLWLFGPSTSATDIERPSQQVASEVFTADSILIGRYYREDRSPVPYDSISPNIVHALVATEDIRFYKHNGVDVFAFASSLLSTAQGEKRGASTITQQLAKNLFRTRYSQSSGILGKVPGLSMVIIKIKEWSAALKLERQYPKNEILTMYLNTVSFGNNSYGIKTAVRRYFNKSASEVQPEEAALLIGMLKATTLYNPVRNPKNATARRNVVLSQMNKAGYLNKDSLALCSAMPLGLSLGKVETTGSGGSYIRTAVEKHLEKWCEERGYNLYEDGLKIYTTIDSRLQRYAEESAYEQMDVLQRRLQQSWGDELPWRNAAGDVIPDFLENLAKKLPYYSFLSEKYSGQPDSIRERLSEKKTMSVFTWDGMEEVRYSTMDSLEHYARLLNTGLMSMDPYSGKIRAWVGGIDHRFFKYDHVNQARRQAGSTFKPFAYLTALQQGMSPCDKFVDRAVRIDYTENGEEKSWEPKNADWNFSGMDMSLRWAMGRSINSVTAQVTERVGWDNVVKSAHECGITSPLASVPSVALGSNDVTVFEMVNAYATFLNRGKKLDPILVDHVTDFNGKTLERFKAKEEQVLDPEVAWLMTYMLRGTMEEPGGTSQALWEWDLWRNGNQIGGKTGTSSDYVDGWYIGISKDLVTGVWVGNDERTIHFRSSATGEGSRTALPIFGKYMERLYQDPASGYTYGPLPESTVAITRKYNCPSPRIPLPDTLSAPAPQLAPPQHLPIGDDDEIERLNLELRQLSRPDSLQ